MVLAAGTDCELLDLDLDLGFRILGLWLLAAAEWLPMSSRLRRHRRWLREEEVEYMNLALEVCPNCRGWTLRL